MNVKEKLITLKEEILKNNLKTEILDDKVDEYIAWYTENMVKGIYTEIGEYHIPLDMRNFIEKMAVWYELRYPDYEINRIMPGSDQETININEMFKDNEHNLNWANFYNPEAFISALPSREKNLFFQPKYPEIVYLDSSSSIAHLHLTANGFVDDCLISKISHENEELKGKHLKSVVKMLKEKGVQLPKNNEIEEAIKHYDKELYQKEEMLNCVMYRIIERGGNRIGPRRAFLFAKEFNRNIEIPMKYGVNLTDPGLKLFIIEYLKAGGSKDLVCYNGYHLRTSKYEKLSTITVDELIKLENIKDKEVYTDEEIKLLYQRLVKWYS